MLCCNRTEDESFKDEEIGEDLYLHCENLLSHLASNIDIKALVNEILFNSIHNYIKVPRLLEILTKYTKYPNIILKYLESAFYIVPNTSKELQSQSYKNYFNFNLKMLILFEVGDFNQLFEEVIEVTPDFNSKHPLYQKDYRLNAIFTIFFFIIFSHSANEEKIDLLFSIFDHDSKHYFYANKNFLRFLTMYVEQGLFMTDFVVNFYLKEHLSLSLSYKKQFIAWKTILIFIKEFPGVMDDYVMHIANNLLFQHKSKQKIYNASISIPGYEESKQVKNLFRTILKANNYQFLSPISLRKKLSHFINNTSETFELFKKELSVMINYYECLHLNKEYPLKLFGMSDKSKNFNLKEQFRCIETKIAPKENFMFLISNKRFLTTKQKNPKVQKISTRNTARTDDVYTDRTEKTDTLLKNDKSNTNKSIINMPVTTRASEKETESNENKDTKETYENDTHDNPIEKDNSDNDSSDKVIEKYSNNNLTLQKYPLENLLNKNELEGREVASSNSILKAGFSIPQLNLNKLRNTIKPIKTINFRAQNQSLNSDRQVYPNSNLSHLSNLSNISSFTHISKNKNKSSTYKSPNNSIIEPKRKGSVYRLNTLLVLNKEDNLLNQSETGTERKTSNRSISSNSEGGKIKRARIRRVIGKKQDNHIDLIEINQICKKNSEQEIQQNGNEEIEIKSIETLHRSGEIKTKLTEQVQDKFEVIEKDRVKPRTLTCKTEKSYEFTKRLTESYETKREIQLIKEIKNNFINKRKLNSGDLSVTVDNKIKSSSTNSLPNMQVYMNKRKNKTLIKMLSEIIELNDLENNNSKTELKFDDEDLHKEHTAFMSHIHQTSQNKNLGITITPKTINQINQIIQVTPKKKEINKTGVQSTSALNTDKTINKSNNDKVYKEKTSQSDKTLINTSEKYALEKIEKKDSKGNSLFMKALKKRPKPKNTNYEISMSEDNKNNIFIKMDNNYINLNPTSNLQSRIEKTKTATFNLKNKNTADIINIIDQKKRNSEDFEYSDKIASPQLKQKNHLLIMNKMNFDIDAGRFETEDNSITNKITSNTENLVDNNNSFENKYKEDSLINKIELLPDNTQQDEIKQINYLDQEAESESKTKLMPPNIEECKNTFEFGSKEIENEELERWEKNQNKEDTGKVKEISDLTENEGDNSDIHKFDIIEQEVKDTELDNEDIEPRYRNLENNEESHIENTKVNNDIIDHTSSEPDNLDLENLNTITRNSHISNSIVKNALHNANKPEKYNFKLNLENIIEATLTQEKFSDKLSFNLKNEEFFRSPMKLEKEEIEFSSEQKVIFTSDMDLIENQIVSNIIESENMKIIISPSRVNLGDPYDTDKYSPYKGSLSARSYRSEKRSPKTLLGINTSTFNNTFRALSSVEEYIIDYFETVLKTIKDIDKFKEEQDQLEIIETIAKQQKKKISQIKFEKNWDINKVNLSAFKDKTIGTELKRYIKFFNAEVLNNIIKADMDIELINVYYFILQLWNNFYTEIKDYKNKLIDKVKLYNTDFYKKMELNLTNDDILKYDNREINNAFKTNNLIIIPICVKNISDTSKNVFFLAKFEVKNKIVKIYDVKDALIDDPSYGILSLTI